MWRNIVEPGRPQMTIWRMRIACWIPKPTNTHSEHIIVIPFLLQQWLHERASMLRFTCTASLVNYKVVITLTNKDQHSVCSCKTTEAISSPSRKWKSVCFEPDSCVGQFILLVRNFKPWSVPVAKYSGIPLNELGKVLLLKSFRKVAKSDDCPHVLPHGRTRFALGLWG
jgi:hypothetical protein